MAISLRLAQQKMAASIGEKLRLEREAHGIALRDISEQTRISMRYLEAIESDDYRRLPGGIFNRSFIRAYAKFIGFDEQEAIEEYNRTLLEHGESTDDSANRPVRSQVYTDDSAHNRSPLMTLLLAIIILAALSLAVWAGLHFYQRSVAPRTNQRVTPGKTPTAKQSGRGIQLPFEVEIAEEGRHEFTV
jgi:cytoskeleton protein RodZ